MTKCIVYYKADGRISVQHPGFHKKPDGMTDNEFLSIVHQRQIAKIPRLQGLDYEIMDASQLPQDRKERDRWRGTKATGIQIDSTVVLRKDLEKEIDDELAVANPNMKKIMIAQRKMDKREHN